MSGALRMLVSAVAGLGVTLGVFWVMTRLIQQPLVLEEDQSTTSVRFFNEIEEPAPPPVQRRTPPPRHEPPDPPTTPLKLEIETPPMRIDVAPEAVTSVLTHYVPRPGRSVWGEGGVLKNGLVPRAMLSPMYPHRALLRGIEGEVTVGFEVGLDGHVARAWILAAQPEGVFEDAALQAVRHWKFVPPTDDEGEPATVEGSQVIAFTLVDDLVGSR